MNKFALSVAGAGVFAAVTLGLATPAFATSDYVVPGHDAVYSSQTDSATIRPVDCSVHVTSGGTDVNVNWC